MAPFQNPLFHDHVPSGFHYRRDFISSDEEAATHEVLLERRSA